MHAIIKLSIVFTFATVPTLFCEQLLADDGTPAKIFELMQEGQDVVITLDIVYVGSEEIKLVRSNSGRNVTVFSWKQFHKIDANDNERLCRGTWDVEEVEECSGELASYYCSDCDDDGVLECPGNEVDWCETSYYFEVIDQCVPVGTVEYTLFGLGWKDAEFDIDSDTLNVSDSGEECTVPGDRAGCSIAAVGAYKSNQPLFLALMMIAMGIAGLLFAPRRPRK